MILFATTRSYGVLIKHQAFKLSTLHVSAHCIFLGNPLKRYNQNSKFKIKEIYEEQIKANNKAPFRIELFVS